MELSDEEKEMLKMSAKLSAYLSVMEQHISDAKKMSMELAEKVMRNMAEHRRKCNE